MGAFPLLLKKKHTWAFISEAGLDATYCGIHLNHDCSGGLYTVSFPETTERLLNQIVESSMVYHLSEPSKVVDTSWIKREIVHVTRSTY